MDAPMDSGVSDLFDPGSDAPEPAGEPMTPEGASPGPPDGGTLAERELTAIVEALLFVSHEPVSLDRLATVLDVKKAEVGTALRALRDDYDREGRGLQVVELAGGWQILTRPDCNPWVKRLEKTKASPKLSRSALESLAIIAYRQPVTRAEIEHIRGVETSGVLRTLLERKLVRIVGRKEVPGRPILYGTTKFFLQHFGLRDLADLPPLREFKELGDPEQATLPVGDEPLVVGSGEPSADALSEVDAVSIPASGDPDAPR